MIEVMAALAAVNTAVKVVKATVSTCQNLESLGPCLSQFFGAKEQAIACVKQGGFKGSALGQAVELELAIEASKQLEESVKMLFFSSNKLEVWNRIVTRSKQITSDQIQSEKREREAAARRKKELDELITLVLMMLVFFVLLGGLGWLIYEVMQQQCGGKC
jgi:preprotein translocase subunit Sss1